MGSVPGTEQKKNAWLILTSEISNVISIQNWKKSKNQITNFLFCNPPQVGFHPGNQRDCTENGTSPELEIDFTSSLLPPPTSVLVFTLVFCVESGSPRQNFLAVERKTPSLTCTVPVRPSLILLLFTFFREIISAEGWIRPEEMAWQAHRWVNLIFSEEYQVLLSRFCSALLFSFGLTLFVSILACCKYKTDLTERNGQACLSMGKPNIQRGIPGFAL